MFGTNPLNFMHKEFLTIQSLLHYARETPGHQGKGIYIAGTVSDELASKIFTSTGLQVAAYSITIDHSAIIHILRQHGQAMEVLRGQITIMEADLLDLAEWLPSPTRVTDAGQHRGNSAACVSKECSQMFSLSPLWKCEPEATVSNWP